MDIYPAKWQPRQITINSNYQERFYSSNRNYLEFREFKVVIKDQR